MQSAAGLSRLSRSFLPMGIIGLLAFNPAAWAVTIDIYGTDATSETSNTTCTIDSTTFENVCGDVTAGTRVGGGLFSALATNAVTLSESSGSRGDARSSAGLDSSPGISTPTLKVEANSAGSNDRAEALAAALEQYTNVGATTQSYNLAINFDGTIEDTSPGDDSLFSLLGAVLVVKTTAVSLDPTMTIDDAADALLLAGLFTPGSVQLATFVFDSVGDKAFSDTLVVDLAVGESAFVLATLGAEAKGLHSHINAFGTLTAGFTGDTSRLAAASTATAIPEPATLVLAALGLLGAGFAKRRCTH